MNDLGSVPGVPACGRQWAKLHEWNELPPPGSCVTWSTALSVSRVSLGKAIWRNCFWNKVRMQIGKVFINMYLVPASHLYLTSNILKAGPTSKVFELGILWMFPGNSRKLLVFLTTNRAFNHCYFLWIFDLWVKKVILFLSNLCSEWIRQKGPTESYFPGQEDPGKYCNRNLIKLGS